MVWDSLGKLIRNEMYQTACRRVAPLENDWDVIPTWWCFRHCEGEKADFGGWVTNYYDCSIVTMEDGNEDDKSSRLLASRQCLTRTKQARQRETVDAVRYFDRDYGVLHPSTLASPINPDYQRYPPDGVFFS